MEGQPSADVIGGTLAVWIEAICARRVFDEATDVARFRAAFQMLMERESRWPSPAKFLDALPSNVVSFRQQKRLDSDENRARGLRHIAEVNRILGVRTTRDDGDDEPPRAA